MIPERVFGLTLVAAPFDTNRHTGQRVHVWCKYLKFMAAILLVATQASFGADTTRVVSQQRLAEFRKTYPGARIRLSENGTPSSISGDLGQGLPAGPPLEVFYGFMEKNKGLFGFSNPRDELRLQGGEGLDKRTGTRHPYFQQVYKGLEVYASGIGAHFNREGVFDDISAVVYPNIDLPVTPTVGEAEAKRIVTQAVASADTLDLSRCQLLVYPWEGRCYLAWQIVAVPDARYVIDALTGKIILRDPRGMFPKIRVIEPEPPIPREQRIPRRVQPSDSLDSSHRGPESEIVDSVPPAPGSPPGTGPTYILRPVPSGETRNPHRPRSGTFSIPPDLRPVTVDTSTEKPSPPKQQSLSTAEPGSVITLLNEGFEGDLPAGNWTLYGSPTWDDEVCRASSGFKSAWCAGSGGLNPCPGTYYPPNMDAWMFWGPFDLSDAKMAVFSFWYWLRSETDYDSFYWGASHDKSTFYGRWDTGSWGSWWLDSLNLCDFLGDSTVWIGFAFRSDDSFEDLGAFVDDVILKKRTDGLPDLTWYAPSSWSDAIVVSSVRGTHTSSAIEVGDTAFIDLAWRNASALCAGSHRVRLFFNSVPIWTSSANTLQPGYSGWEFDIPYLITSTGSHLLRLVVDVDSTVCPVSAQLGQI